MKTIWKFPIPIEDEFILEMPERAKVLTVQTQENPALANLDVGCLWAIVNPEAPKLKYKFRVFGTGNPFPDDHALMEYIGTFQMQAGRLVWHLFRDHSYAE